MSVIYNRSINHWEQKAGGICYIKAVITLPWN